MEDKEAQFTYKAAVADGFYQRNIGGLTGKYDNVRRYWEDQITRYVLHDFIEGFVNEKRQLLTRIRVLDLGCGAGEGYEILTNPSQRTLCLATKEVDVMPAEMLDCYKGIDISEAMVEQGRKTYNDSPKMTFEIGDLSQGLSTATDDPPYDIYFSSYGSLAHLKDDDFRRLVKEICNHFQDRCVFVADMLGRYSYEWQVYWDEQGSDETNMRQYSMSYLYPPEIIDQIEVERFPMRYWGGKEFDEAMSEIAVEAGVEITRRTLNDRSIIVGRHMDTAEYNPYAQPLRDVVNQLHEFNYRTDLQGLIFDYSPHPDHPELNTFFEQFQMAWNAVVYACIEALEYGENGDWQPPEIPAEYPDVLTEAIHTIRDVIRNLKWFRMGDPLANIVEPQLGYILRNLEQGLQNGLGAGHGLLAVYEFSKEK